MKKLTAIAIMGLGMGWGHSTFAQDWAASCGNEPKAPSINVSNISNYNASVDRLRNYDKAVRPYYACIVKQARAKQLFINQKAKNEMEVVHKSMAEINTRITNNLNKMQAEIVAANKKLKGTSGKK